MFPIYANFWRDFLKMISLTPVFLPQIGSLGTGIYQMFHKYKLLLPLSAKILAQFTNYIFLYLTMIYPQSWPTKDTAPYPAFGRPKIEGHSEYRNICHKITLGTPVKAHISFMRSIL